MVLDLQGSGKNSTKSSSCHSASFKVNIFHKHGAIIKTKNLTLGIILLTKPPTSFELKKGFLKYTHTHTKGQMQKTDTFNHIKTSEEFNLELKKSKKLLTN
jgi:hypothetical protein